MSRVLPILFNTEMVRAILTGRKTATRRLIRPRYKEDESGFEIMTNMGTGERWVEKVDEEEMSFDPPRYITPPYQSGDILYVRETWGVMRAKRYDAIVDIAFKAGGENKTIYFPYGGTDNANRNKYDEFIKKWSKQSAFLWHPSIHMPKAAARIWLKVTDVRVERLQDIDGQGVLKEGLNSLVHPEADYFDTNQREMFENLWNSTIKKSDQNIYGWEANPWVWVIEFEKCENPRK